MLVAASVAFGNLGWLLAILLHTPLGAGDAFKRPSNATFLHFGFNKGVGVFCMEREKPRSTPGAGNGAPFCGGKKKESQGCSRGIL